MSFYRKVPDTFRIVRNLLDRLEDSQNGEIRPEFLKVNIPPQRYYEVSEVADFLKENVYNIYPYTNKNGSQITVNYFGLCLVESFVMFDGKALEAVVDLHRAGGNAIY